MLLNIFAPLGIKPTQCAPWYQLTALLVASLEPSMGLCSYAACSHSQVRKGSKVSLYIWTLSYGWLVMCGLVQHGKLSGFSVYASNGTGTLQITRLGYHGQSYELRGLS